jgi:hypothetical protein
MWPGGRHGGSASGWGAFEYDANRNVAADVQPATDDPTDAPQPWGTAGVALVAGCGRVAPGLFGVAAEIAATAVVTPICQRTRSGSLPWNTTICRTHKYQRTNIKEKKMKNTIANTLSKYNPASWRSRIGTLALIAFFACSLTISASAQWTLISAPTTMAGIQVGSSQVWTRDSSGNLYQYKSGALTAVPAPVTFDHLAVGEGQSVWALSSGDIYTYSFKKPKGFQKVPGTLTYIGAGQEGVWGVNSGESGGDVYVYNSSTNSFDPPPHGEPSEHFDYIFAGNFAIGPWGLDQSGGAWLYNTNTQFFDGPTGGTTLTQISVGEGQVWGVNGSSDPAWMYDVSSETWVQPDKTTDLSEVSVYADTNVWGVNGAGQVFKYNDKKIKFVLTAQPPEPIFLIRVGGPGIFALAKAGNVYKYK